MKSASNAPLPPPGPADTSSVVAPARRYMSRRASVSAAVRASLVLRKTRVPSAELPSKAAGRAPLPPAGPVESSVVVPPERP